MQFYYINDKRHIWLLTCSKTREQKFPLNDFTLNIFLFHLTSNHSSSSYLIVSTPTSKILLLHTALPD